ARQDSAQPALGNVRAPPAAARHRDQACAAARAAAVYQRAHRIGTPMSSTPPVPAPAPAPAPAPGRAGPAWGRVLVALLLFLLWAPPSLVGLPCAALLIIAPGSERGGWSQPIAGLIGAISVALLVVGSGDGSRLGAATSTYIELASGAFVSLVLLRPDTILRQALRSMFLGGVATALLIQAIWGGEAWSALAWEATRDASLTMRLIVEVAPDAFPIYEPMVRFISMTWPGMLALQTLAGLALAWQLHR